MTCYECDHEIDLHLFTQDKNTNNFAWNEYWDLGLRKACEDGDNAMVDFMIAKGANDFGWAVYGAAINGHLELCKRMLELYKLNPSENVGVEIALEGAYRGEQWEIIRYLVENGAQSFTECLEDALKEERPRVIIHSVKHGADLDEALEKYHSPRRGVVNFVFDRYIVNPKTKFKILDNACDNSNDDTVFFVATHIFNYHHYDPDSIIRRITKKISKNWTWRSNNYKFLRRNPLYIMRRFVCDDVAKFTKRFVAFYMVNK